MHPQSQTEYANAQPEPMSAEQALALGASEDRVMFYEGLRETHARLSDRREQLVAAVEEIDRHMHGVSAALNEAPDGGAPAIAGARGR